MSSEPRISVVLSWSGHDGYVIETWGGGVELGDVAAGGVDRRRRMST